MSSASPDQLGVCTDEIERCLISQSEISVDRYRIIGPDGEYDPDNLPDLSLEDYKKLLRGMLFQRRFDERAVSLQRRGELGTYGEGRGQEASIIGSAYAFEEDDWIFPTGRMSAVAWMRGVSIETLIKYWRGIETAGSMDGTNCFPFAIEIGSHLPTAVGVAQGARLSNASHVVGAYIGDGGTSTAAFLEAMNFSGVRSAPLVVINQNNQYAISVPFEEQTAAETLAQKALAFGIGGLRVDGNDILAVYDAVRRSRELGIEGMPMLLELVTYRMGAHTTNDDPARYRTQEEVEAWRQLDPIKRFRDFLKSEGLWDKIDEERMKESIDKEINEGISAADEFPHRDPEGIFDHVYDEMPPNLVAQRQEFENLLQRRQDIEDFIEQRPKG